MKNKTSALKGALVFFATLVLNSCSHKTLGLFFDVPPPQPQEIEETTTPESSATTNSQDIGFTLWSSGIELEALPIEDLKSWEAVLEMLPKDYKKDADWSAAVNQGVIRPRPGKDPRSQYATMFKYDFIIEAENPKNEAYFPHSSHTEWLGCKNCHMDLYPYKRNPATMKEMRQGASCGKCHGNVAFSLKQCKRCHLQR